MSNLSKDWAWLNSDSESNAFDNRHGVKAYIKKLKSILMWNFLMLEHVEIISSNAYSGFLMALQDVPLNT